jgi:ADP-ribose pyrophosphatase YjhB (NUDIX family)
MEPGEGVKEACAREVLEETGLRVEVGRLVAIYTNPHFLIEYEDGNRYQLVVLMFRAEPIGGVLRGSEETTEVRYYSREEIGSLEMGGLDRQRVSDAFDDRERAFVREEF